MVSKQLRIRSVVLRLFLDHDTPEGHAYTGDSVTGVLLARMLRGGGVIHAHIFMHVCVYTYIRMHAYIL